MATQKRTVRYGCDNTVESADFDQVWVATSGGTVFTDETADAASNTGTDVTLGGSVDDAIYFGSDVPYVGFAVDTSTNAAGGTRVLEYYNGSSWAGLTATYLIGGVLLSADTSASFAQPSDWVPTVVNSGASLYYTRIRTTSAQSTPGVLVQASPAKLVDLAAGRTITISETSSRTFSSVFAKIFVDNTIPNHGDLLRVEARLGGSGAYTAVTDVFASTVLGQSTETAGMTYHADLTSVFSSGFGGGATQTFDLRIARLCRGNAANASGNNRHANAEVFVTYEYDNAAATQMNTIVLPLDSLTGELTTSQQTVGGTGGIPILTGASGVIKEASPTITDLYVVFEYGASEGGSTAYSFVAQMDSATEVDFGSNLSSNCNWNSKIVWRHPSLVTTSAHDLKARVTNTAGGDCANIGAYLVVTYSYDDTSTTTVNVCRQFHLDGNPAFAEGTTAADGQVFEVEFWVPETSPTLIQSGIHIYLHGADDVGTYAVAVGGQTARSYSHQHGTVHSGPSSIFQRFDSGGAAGAGHTLTRGKNVLSFKTYATGTLLNAGGEAITVYLNYTATKSAGKKSTCVQELLIANSYTQVTNASATKAIAIPETEYWLDHVGVMHGDINPQSLTVNALKVSKGSGAGYYVAAGSAISDGFLGDRFFTADMTYAFKRHPGDPTAGRLDIETSRTWRVGANGRLWAVACIQWHNFTWTVSGTWSQYADADGAGLTTYIQRWDTGERVGSAVTTAGGAYTFTWYDNTAEMHAVLLEDASHTGSTWKGVAE